MVLNAGFLVTSVLETLHNGMDIAIPDTSAACHMPDVLEMPYRPPCRILARAGKRPIPTGWAAPPVWRGDVIGDYSFDAPPERGRPAGV